MKYFSSESVANAYKGFQGSITNKSWGVLAIMHQLDSMIVPGRTYAVNCSSLSTYIEKLFCLGSKKSYIDNGKEWYVKFSTQWNDFFDKQGQTIPNIFDIIIWAYRSTPLPDDITNEKLIAMFSEDFHLSISDIMGTFYTEGKDIEYNDYLEPDSTVLSKISGKLGTTLSKNITSDGKSVTASPGELSRGPFIQPLYAALETADFILVSQTNFDELYPIEHRQNYPLTNENDYEQKIFFGTPGSGKSWTIKETYEKDGTKVVRTTFHPDTDYAQFVGCYKPKTYEEDGKKKISYEFTPQAFTEAYVKAWSDLEHPYYLIIEEINRGNCAQIFGDLFQLLDRNKEGYSEYPIKADNDLKDYLMDHLPEDSEGIKDGKLCLPPNLSIIASMNTSDQSLFPMDSAFKRRWSWEYVPIDYKNAESAKFEINIGGEPENWHEFLKKINEKIKKVTSSEDKQMGNFFIKGSIDEKEFCDKVMFYLWSEVGKDNYQTSDAIFKYYDGDEKEPKEFSFNELYDAEKRTALLKGFIRYIKDSEA